MRSDKTLREEAKIEDWLKKHAVYSQTVQQKSGSNKTIHWSAVRVSVNLLITTDYGTKLAALRKAKRMIEAEERNK